MNEVDGDSQMGEVDDTQNFSENYNDNDTERSFFYNLDDTSAEFNNHLSLMEDKKFLLSK